MTSGLTTRQSDVVGVLCTKGTRDGDPNTRLRGVSIGPGYGLGVIAGTETQPVETGCNLDVAGSRIHEVWTGIWQFGCGAGEGRVLVGLRVHDTRFDGIHGSDAVYAGRGIHVWDCARELVVESSTFADSDAGVDMVRHSGEPPGKVVITNNLFSGLQRGGIMTALAVYAEIRGNRFTNVTGMGEFLGRAAALKIYVDGIEGPSLVVRDNKFVENDLGVEIWGLAPFPTSARIDLGRPGDLGNNTFFCNAAPEVSQVPGGDVAIRLPAAPGARLDLAGNIWDHAEPTRATAATNGLDVLEIAGSPLTLDASQPRTHGRTTCIQRRR
jgi:hypothetical protein